MFSKSCHYALQAMLYIGRQYHKQDNVDLNEIAWERNIPKHFLSKILQLLVRHKLLTSMKGPTGGFKLTRPPERIRLIEIVEAIDGLELFEQCGIGLKICSDLDPCIIHPDYKHIRERVRKLFEKKTLVDLSRDVDRGDNIIGLEKPDRLT